MAASSSSSTNPVLAQISHAQSSGFLDHYTSDYYHLKQYQDDPKYFLRMLLSFLNDAPASIAKIEASLSQNVLDFSDLVEDTIKLRGCSACTGAFRLRNACSDLRLAADNCWKDGCVQAIYVAKREFAAVKPHVDAILKLEREDILNGHRHQG